MRTTPMEHPKLQLAASAREREPLLHLLQKNDLPTADIQSLTHLYALWNGDRLIGAGGLEYYADNALLRSVSVTGEARAKGYGKLITAQLEEIAHANDSKAIFLLTTTADSFFAKLGYSKIERDEVPEAVRQSTEFASVCPTTAVVMRKKL